MFSKLVFRNAKRSRKENGIYFATLVTAIASFYIILSLGKQDIILFLKEFESDAIDKLLNQMPVLYAFALFLLFFLILFANRYQFHRRSKEFGVYLMLGMRKKRLTRQLLFEGLVISFWALIGGILIGIFLAEIISLTVSKLVGQGIIGHQMTFSIRAVLYTVAGFLTIQVGALSYLSRTLFHQEIHHLLYEEMNKKLDMGLMKSNVFHLFTGLSILCIAYWLVLNHLVDYTGTLLLIAVILGCVGTILFMRGFGRLLSLLIRSSKWKSTKGLHIFTVRQFQENIAHKSTTVAVTSILITLSIMLLTDGASTFIGVDRVLTRDSSIYDFTVHNESQDIKPFLTSEKMVPYVEDLHLLEIGQITSTGTYDQDGFPLSLLDWKPLRKALIQALPTTIKGQVLSGDVQSYSISSENSEALNLFGMLETETFPSLIPESSYNGLLQTINEEPLHLQANEVALYINPDVIRTDGSTHTPELRDILEDAANNRKPLIKIDGQEQIIRPAIPMKGLVADRSVEIYVAYIVPDDLFEQFINPETYASYWNFRIPQQLQDEQGLMTPMFEARALLQDANVTFESYLENYGRTLFYIVAGSYSTLFLGFLFLIIACTVLALQFLTQMEQTKKRYTILSMLGAKQSQMKKSMHRQVLLTFLLPLSLALISGIIGIRAMISFTMIHINDNEFLFPMTVLFASIVIFIFVIYGVAVASTANRQIEQLYERRN